MEDMRPDRKAENRPKPTVRRVILRMTRPLCAHSKRTKYQGAGDTNDAASFLCVQEKKKEREEWVLPRALYASPAFADLPANAREQRVRHPPQS
jgi:hypothetical protein